MNVPSAGCAGPCPVDLDPRELFLDMRREAVAPRGSPLFPSIKCSWIMKSGGLRNATPIMPCRKVATRSFFPWLRASRDPAQADPSGLSPPAFFHPRPGDRPGLLHQALPRFGPPGLFSDTFFGEMKDYLLQNGVRTVLTACPNCYRVFKEYGDRPGGQDGL